MALKRVSTNHEFTLSQGVDKFGGCGSLPLAEALSWGEFGGATVHHQIVEYSGPFLGNEDLQGVVQCSGIVAVPAFDVYGLWVWEL